MRNTAIDFLYETVKLHPDKQCVCDEYTDLNFDAFFKRAYHLAELLKSSNLIDQPVVVYLPKSADAVVAFAATLLSSNCYVPVDVKSPLSRVVKIINNCSPCRVVTRKTYEKQIQSLGVKPEHTVYIEDSEAGSTNIAIDAMVQVCKKQTDAVIDTDPCYIMHTSGSTGVPKGVVVAHRGVIDYIEWAVSCLKIDAYDTLGNQAPFYFDNSTLDIYLCWATGAALNVIPERMFLFPVKLVDYLEKHRITSVFFVPSVLINVAQRGVLNPQRLPDLHTIVFAGEVMPTKHLAYWQKNLPNKRYINLYGPTEITVDCTYFVVDRIYNDDERLPIGYPCVNSGILILNENNQCTAADEPGELCVRGSSLALGYWNDTEKTRQVFVQNPLQKKYFDRIYRTGDIVCKNRKGQIVYIGRKDSQIKHNGYRIELEEIERAAQTLPYIIKCCAAYNYDQKELALFYESEQEQDPGVLKTDLQSVIPVYMIPRKYHYHRKLPLNSSGKVDRKSLKELGIGK